MEQISSGDLAASFEYQLAHIHDSRQRSIVILNVCFSVLATVAVVCRLWARRLVKVPWRYDDYTIILALVRPPLLRTPALALTASSCRMAS